ncbi:trigger factor [Thalassoglobus neptunius]
MVVSEEVEQNVDETETAGDVGLAESPKMDLTVSIDDVGPCKKHVRVSVPRDSIDEAFSEVVDEYSEKAEVPGFRVGNVPSSLVARRFKTEIADQVKQRVLMASLEQLGEESDLDPINEPNLDLESIVIPEEGDFEYEFDVEVRPEFELPTYKGLKIDRPTRETTDEEVNAYLDQFLDQYGKLVPVDAPAEDGDFVTANITVEHDGKPLAHIEDISIRVRPKLRFQDAELDGFNEIIAGVSAGESREADLTVSMEADSIGMRGETVHAKFDVLDVKRMETPTLDEEFLERIGVESEEDLRSQIHGMLDRQVKYEQRQAIRRQVLEKITESADWELPEDLVTKQVDNALKREILEMQQAGFTSREILARENDLRQRSLSMTRQNLKEHFVLDRIAEIENIDVTEEDLEVEILSMAMQRGENPRRIRAKMIKNGSIENLQAQIRERKAVDIVFDSAEFNDVPLPPTVTNEVEALNRSICRTASQADATQDDDDAEDE